MEQDLNWRILVTFVAAAMLAIAGFGLLELSETWTLHDTQVITAKPLSGMLPSRDDLAAEWLGGYSYDATLDVSGFEEGGKVSYHKRIGSTHSQKKEYQYFITFYVYRFSDANGAKMYYDKRVNEIETEGGYSEVEIPGIFAGIYDYGTTEEGFSLGHAGNIVFGVYVYNNTVFRSGDELIDLTNLLKDKIA